MSKEIIKALRDAPGCYEMGWRLPEHTNWKDEQMSWKKTCYIGDWSFLRNLVVKGPDALKLLSDISVNSYAKFDIGQGKHIICCNEDGKLITEGIVLRTNEQEFRIQSVPAFYTDYKLHSGKYNATSRHDDTFHYQVQGPNALYLVEKLAGESLRDISFMRFRKIYIKGREVIALRQGMSGEIGGFELQGPMEYGQEIYNAVLEAGQDFGIRQLGRRTALINHLEAYYPTYNHHYVPAMFGKGMEGFQEWVAANFPMLARTWKISGSFEGNDISDYYTSPVEMGWKRIIKFDHDFIGRKALEAEVANPKRTAVTLEWNNDDVIDIYASLFREGEPYDFIDIPQPERFHAQVDQVLKDGKLVGKSTIPGYSYYFRKMLTLSYIDIELTKPGTGVTIILGNPGTPQKHVRATVASVPYKKDDRRGDLKKLPAYLKK